MKVQDVRSEINTFFSNCKLNNKLMKTFFRPLLGVLMGAGLMFSCEPGDKQTDWDSLANVFIEAPDSIQTVVSFACILEDNVSFKLV